MIAYLAVVALVVLAAALLTACGATRQWVETAPAGSPYEIRLQSREFTPEEGVPADLGARIAHVISQVPAEGAPETARAHILVQLQAPPEPGDRERLAAQDPLSALRRRDLWVCLWRVADALERTGHEESGSYWQRTYRALCDTEQSGFLTSSQDQEYLHRLRDKLGAGS